MDAQGADWGGGWKCFLGLGQGDGFGLAEGKASLKAGDRRKPRTRTCVGAGDRPRVAGEERVRGESVRVGRMGLESEKLPDQRGPLESFPPRALGS